MRFKILQAKYFMLLGIKIKNEIGFDGIEEEDIYFKNSTPLQEPNILGL